MTSYEQARQERKEWEERTADRRDEEEPSTLQLMLVQLTRIADSLDKSLGRPPEIDADEVNVALDGTDAHELLRRLDDVMDMFGNDSSPTVARNLQDVIDWVRKQT